MCQRIPPGTSAEYGSTVGSLRVARLEHIAHRFSSEELYICLSNKCFKVCPVYSLCTDIRPSQDHRILRMQTVRINLAVFLCRTKLIPFLKYNFSVFVYFQTCANLLVEIWCVTSHRNQAAIGQISCCKHKQPHSVSPRE